jgi:hypothetical protein
MSNALAMNNMPAYLQKYKSETPDVAQFGHLERADFSLNIIKCVTPTSPQMRAGWGPTKKEPALPLGTLFLSRSGVVLPPGTPFIPLCRAIRYILWQEDGSRLGKMIFATENANDERITSIKGLEFTVDPVTKKNKAPLVTTYINFYVMLKGVDAPVIFPFKRTSTPDGRRLTQDIVMATQGGHFPMFTLVFKLTGFKEMQGNSNFWHIPTWEAAGKTGEGRSEAEAEELLKRAAKMKELAQNLATAASAEEFAEHDAEDAPAAPPVQQTTLKQVQGTLVPITPPAPVEQPVQQAPVAPPVQQAPIKLQDTEPGLTPVW